MVNKIKLFKFSFFNNLKNNKDKIELYKNSVFDFSFDSFSLKKIFLSFEKINSFFHNEINEQFFLEENLEKSKLYLETNFELLNSLNKKNNALAESFYSPFSKNQVKLQNNCFSFSKPTFVEKMNLKIDNFIYDDDYYFELIIDTIDFQNKKVKILPLDINSGYFEKATATEDFISRFDVLENYGVYFLNKSNETIKIDFSLKDDKIYIKKEDLLFDDIKVFYEPVFDSTNIFINSKVTKVFLNTNFDKNKIKKISYTVGEDNV